MTRPDGALKRPLLALGGPLASSGSKLSACRGGPPDGVKLPLGGQVSPPEPWPAPLAHAPPHPMKGFVVGVSCLAVFGGAASEINQQVLEGFQDRTQDEACARVQGPLVSPGLAHTAYGTAGLADKVWSRSAGPRGRLVTADSGRGSRVRAASGPSFSFQNEHMYL